MAMGGIPFVLHHAIGEPDADARGDKAEHTHDDADELGRGEEWFGFGGRRA